MLLLSFTVYYCFASFFYLLRLDQSALITQETIELETSRFHWKILLVTSSQCFLSNITA